MWDRVDDRGGGHASDVSRRPKTAAVVPAFYGRAMLVDMPGGGSQGGRPSCVDLKRSGLSAPNSGYHDNGLLSLHAALGEFFKTTALEAALDSDLMGAVSRPLIGQYAVFAHDYW